MQRIRLCYRSPDSLVDNSDDDDDDNDDGVSLSSSDYIRASSSSFTDQSNSNGRRVGERKVELLTLQKEDVVTDNPSSQQHGTASSSSRTGRGHGPPTCTAAPTGTGRNRRAAPLHSIPIPVNMGPAAGTLSETGLFVLFRKE